jgi:zeaxanthin glucosyltransferase
MGNIGFGMVPQHGHLNPTLRLAHSLKARGHQITYLSVPDYEDWVTGHGFEFVPVFEEVFPRGSLARERALPLEEHAAYRAELFARYREYLRGGAFDERLRGASFDLVLADTLHDFLVMAARHASVPCLRLSTSLPQTAAPGVPPLSSGLPFGDTPERLAAVDRAWAELTRRHEANASGEYGEMRRLLLAKYEYPSEWLDFRATFEPDLVRTPELILCSPLLDFPRPPESSRHYVESMWLDRAEPAPAWWQEGGDGPCIYCSLGSEAHRYGGARRFFSEVFAAAARLPECRFVVSAGAWLSHPDFPEPPDNVVAVPYAPQLWLLQRCRLVMTSGGLNTLKESFYFGNPALVFPVAYDQPGNAARVAYRGLGLSADFHAVTAAQIVDMIRRALDDRQIARRVAVVRESLVELEESRPGLSLVERLLAGA